MNGRAKTRSDTGAKGNSEMVNFYKIPGAQIINTNENNQRRSSVIYMAIYTGLEFRQNNDDVAQKKIARK